MTNGSVRFKIDTSGNVGVGTANPGFKLSVHQTTAWNGGLGFTSTMDANRWDVGSQGGGLFGIYPNQNGNLGIALIAGTGNVGIGVNGPTAKLDINGTLRVRSGGGSNITGTLGDIAEYMLVKNDKEFELGDVVIININKPLHLELSNKPYDTLVGGVVSGENQAAFIIGEKQENQIPVALAGKVVCKVVNENGPIAIGDLLTTSSKPGYAMKATEPKPGSILGKALEHLNDTEGKIHILVNVN